MSASRHSSLLRVASASLCVVACIELNVEPPGEDVNSGGHVGGAVMPAGGVSAGGGGAHSAGENQAGEPPRGGHSGEQQGGSSGEPHGGAGQTSAQGGEAEAGGGGAPSNGGTAPNGGTSSGGASGTASGGLIGTGGTSPLGGTSGQGGISTGGSSSVEGGSSGESTSGGTPSGGSGGAPSVDPDYSGGGPLDANDRCGFGELGETFSTDAMVLAGNLDVHDPVTLAVGNRYFLFHTGARIPVKTSSNLRDWSNAGSVFNSNPAWISSLVPGASDLWAPDISHFGGSYHLYYSASTFGSNRSCIGHATRNSLDSGSWFDRGPVVCSNVGGPGDDWNAIDPNLILDGDGVPWLFFGSFWSGIKAVKLDSSGVRADEVLHSIAARNNDGKAIEAPFITRRCGYYYLFVSFDFCCRGSSSNYRQLVGRSTDLLGPYLDRAGRSLLDGGGTPLLQGNSRWRGPGHNALLFVGERAYNVYHSYDAQNQGRAQLRIAELVWDSEGWPISGGP